MTVREEIEQLKKEKNAVILAHYYVRPEVQELADYIGDSFYLSKVAVGLKEQTIVFCGVSFMGESAKILNPEKTVLMPDAHADCAMAHMADEETIREMREKYEDLAVVCYINSTAELKRCSDVCVTSANAVKIVRRFRIKTFSLYRTAIWRIISLSLRLRSILYTTGILSGSSADASGRDQKSERRPSGSACADTSGVSGGSAGAVGLYWKHIRIIEYAQKSNASEFIICTENGVRYELENDVLIRNFILQRRSLSVRI